MFKFTPKSTTDLYLQQSAIPLNGNLKRPDVGARRKIEPNTHRKFVCSIPPHLGCGDVFYRAGELKFDAEEAEKACDNKYLDVSEETDDGHVLILYVGTGT